MWEKGPYLRAAFLCEKVLQEADGVKSAIRIIDRVTVTSRGPEPPEQMPAITYRAYLFVSFKSGWARGTSTLTIAPVAPSGERRAPYEQAILFEGEEDRGVDVVINLTITLDETGIWWFDILLDGRVVTRVPLRVIYRFQRNPSTSEPSQSHP